MKKFTRKDFLIFGGCILLAGVAIFYNQKLHDDNLSYFARPLSTEDLGKYSNTDPRAVIIYPIFTQNAYKNGGFYDYFNGTCGTCDTVSLNPLVIDPSYVTGVNSLNYLTQLHYPFITDIMVDRHPEILNEYDKVILLHNEYVTKKEFDAISNHKNVIYLYPNSLYTEISVDYNTMKMNLVRGHGYDITQQPHYMIKTGDASANGFGFLTSSKHEYDLKCTNYKWEEMPNGISPTCWPSFLIQADRNMLQVIKDFPDKKPVTITLANDSALIQVPDMDKYGMLAH